MTALDVFKQFEPYFLLTDEKLQEIVRCFRLEMEEGLANYGHDMAMIPAFVTGVPDGSEEGAFLALDLGGTNLRVCLVLLQGNHKFQIKQQKYKVSQALKEGESRELFDYIAESVDAFLTDVQAQDEIPIFASSESMHLGFTFSFPVEQTAIDAGALLTWTKGFNAKNAVGHDVVRLLQDAFDRKHMHVRCSALVNDTVGTLLSRSYQNGPALIGAIFGTGTNGAFIDKTQTIRKLGEERIREEEALGEHAGKYMVVNTEWGAFDNKANLGEITRNILLYMIDSNILFNGYSSTILETHYGFDTSFVSAVEGATTNDEVKSHIIHFLDVDSCHITEECLEIVRLACRVVSDRACKLSACAIAAVVQHTGNDKAPDRSVDKGVDVGMDGSVVEFLPRFNERVRTALEVLLGVEGAARIRMGLAKDGSGVGAALTALQAKKALDARKL
nr:hexokinase [Cryptococcus depauperatus CBS 7841]